MTVFKVNIKTKRPTIPTGKESNMGVRTTGLAKRANKSPGPPPEPQAKSLSEIEDERVLKLFEEAGLVEKEKSELIKLIEYTDEILKKLKG